MAQISLVKLRKEFSGTVAVQDIDLDIKDREFLVLIGPSGCGKTTTLRMVAGLEEPTSGNILIDERTATDLEPGERNLGMVFQNLALFPHKTVRENIAFGLRMLPAQCSGGEAQRVALARTLITGSGRFPAG